MSSVGPHQNTSQSRIIRSAVVNIASISLRITEAFALPLGW